MRTSKIFKLILAILVCELAGIIGSIFTRPEIGGWYADLVKPALNPPNWVFGPVWTTLYALMGVAVFLILILDRSLITEGQKKVKWAFGFFVIQLILNTFWSILFFGLGRIDLALIEIVFLWLFILLTIISFYRLNRLAAYLLVPYLLWASFASYLNFSLWLLN